MIKLYYLYKLTSPSGKQYVGATGLTIQQRVNDHSNSAKEGRQYPICAAIRKHGINNFKVEEIMRDSKEYISEMEKHRIKKSNTLVPNGYNFCEGGLNEVTWTEELRLKQSEKATAANNRRYENPEERERQRTIAKNQWNDPEFRAKMLAGRKRYFSKASNL